MSDTTETEYDVIITGGRVTDPELAAVQGHEGIVRSREPRRDRSAAMHGCVDGSSPARTPAQDVQRRSPDTSARETYSTRPSPTSRSRTPIRQNATSRRSRTPFRTGPSRRTSDVRVAVIYGWATVSAHYSASPCRQPRNIAALVPAGCAPPSSAPTTASWVRRASSSALQQQGPHVPPCSLRASQAWSVERCRWVQASTYR